MKRLSAESFIEKSNKMHKNNYDYSKTIYKNCRSNVLITCFKHGDFVQKASDHLNGNGCSKCGGVYRRDTSQFVIEANLIHHNFYDYSKSSYINKDTKLIIVCRLHGTFNQSPHSHLRGAGCPVCNGGIKLNTQEFIYKAKQVHASKYDYSQTKYHNSKTKIGIICLRHGKFFQTPNDHLGGANCPKCTSLGRTSIIEQEWLDYLNIPKNNRNIQLKINNKIYYVDGFDPQTKTIYEFYGDFWHGNPKIYNSNDINKVSKKSFKVLYEDTMARENIFKIAGYTIYSIWESEWNKK